MKQKKTSNTSDLTRLAKAGVMKPFLEEKLAFYKVNLVTLSENQESQAKKKLGTPNRFPEIALTMLIESF